MTATGTLVGAAVSPQRWAAVMIAGFLTVVAIQPSADTRPPTQPLWADVAAVATLGLLSVASIALLCGRRWGFGPASYGSGGLFALAMLCPAWSHHQIGWWWVCQGAVSAVLFGGSLACRSRARFTTDRAMADPATTERAVTAEVVR